MKRFILSLSAAALCSLSAIAQESATPIFRKLNDPRTVGKTTGTESRLKSIARFAFSGGAMNAEDSSYNSYVGHNAWDPISQQWKFDKSTRLVPNGGNFDVNARYTNTFDAHTRIKEQLGEEWDGSSWNPFHRIVYIYTAQGQIDTMEKQTNTASGWFTYFRNINAYDAQGRLIRSVEQSDTFGGVLQNRSLWTKAYKAQGKIEQDTLHFWASTSSGMAWMPYWLQSYYYYSGSNAAREGRFLSGGGSYDSTLYTYDSKGNLVEEVGRAHYGSNWYNTHKYLYTYDAQGNQTSKTLQRGVGSSSVNSKQTITTYNSFNQPIEETYKKWNDAAGQFEFADSSYENHYYYEIFTNDVKDVAAASQGTMKVYPNPAVNTLTINLNWDEEQPATAMLIDLTGKVAAQWAISSNKNTVQTFDISSVPSGSYILKVVGSKGQLNRNLIIER